MIPRRLLYWLSGRLRCRCIPIADRPYMERYWLGKSKRLGTTAYIHRFIGSDGDRNLHDHPWGWSFAIVLAGGYTEKRLRWFDPDSGWQSTLRFIGGWRRINIIRARDFHQISQTHPETWTLFIHTRRIKGWGFLQHATGGSSNIKATVYQQPLDTKAAKDWQKTAPLGKDHPDRIVMGSLL